MWRVHITELVTIMVILSLLLTPPFQIPNLWVIDKSKDIKLDFSHPVLTGDIYVAGHERPHSELCPSLGEELQLLILITSAPNHIEAREAIRLTWGHYAARSDIAIGFFIGYPPNHINSTIEAEDMLYNDIIIGRFIDSYYNLTLKSLSMLEWVDTYCPRVPRVLKTDDDMFINVNNLLDFVNEDSRINATKTVWGNVLTNCKPIRNNSSKYYVPPMQYPYGVFPDYTTGPAYLLTSDIVKGLLSAASVEPYLNIEDAFMTGVLASKLSVSRVHVTDFIYTPKKSLRFCMAKRAMSVHMVQYEQQFEIWRKLLDGRKMTCLS